MDNMKLVEIYQFFLVKNKRFRKEMEKKYKSKLACDIKFIKE